MLKAHGLKYVRNGQEILANIDVIVEPGETLAVTGPSGSGKTTLLALLSGLAAPTAGEVYIDGKPVTKFAGPALGVAVVLQGYGLVSLLTAAENIEIALGAAGRSSAEAARTTHEVLTQLGLEAHADQLVEELSGGQQQRTAVARALALEPRLLIADEPTAELDPAARAVALARMFEVAANGGSLILATHDPEVAARCDRILDLRAGLMQSQRDQPHPDRHLPVQAPPVQAPPVQPQLDRPSPVPPPGQPGPDQPVRSGERRSSPWRKPAHALPEPILSAAQEVSDPAGTDSPDAQAAQPPHLPPASAAPSAIPAVQPQPSRAVPPRSGSAQHERLASSALPPLHRRGVMLRDYLEEVRRRACNAASLPGAGDQHGPRTGPAGLVAAAADLSSDDLAFLGTAREELVGFADLGLRLLELHQRMDLSASTGDPSGIVPRCLSCMWRWPCPTFLTLAEILDGESGLG